MPRFLHRVMPQLQQVQPSLACLGRLIHAAAAGNEHTFPLSPGGLLHICCTQPGTSVAIKNGAEDAVSLQVHAGGTAADTTHASSSGSSSSPVSMQLLPGGRIVEVIEALPAAAAAAAVEAGPCSSHTLSLAMPSRFCGVHVATAGGAVSVGKVNEADLQLVTQGGAASVQHCKANNAAINTAADPQQPAPGGTIQVGELSAANLQLRSGGGSIQVQRMFALDAQLLTEGGGISIGAMYGVKAHLDSGRGPIAIGHMSCRGLAQLQSGGGSMRVDGLEGNASLISHGGDVKVHLHEKTGHVFVDSSGGAVEAWINPAAAVSLQVAAGGGVELDPGLKVTGEWGPVSLKGVTAGSGSSNDTSAAAAASGSALFAQPLGSSFNSSRLHRSAGEVAQFAAGGGGQHHHTSEQVPTSSSNTQGCCKTQQAIDAAAGQCNGSGGCGSAVRQLVINAGGGRVTLKAMGWMDAIRAKLQTQSG